MEVPGRTLRTHAEFGRTAFPFDTTAGGSTDAGQLGDAVTVQLPRGPGAFLVVTRVDGA
jgi:hypothetical protein